MRGLARATKLIFRVATLCRRISVVSHPCPSSNNNHHHSRHHHHRRRPRRHHHHQAQYRQQQLRLPVDVRRQVEMEALVGSLQAQTSRRRRQIYPTCLILQNPGHRNQSDRHQHCLRRLRRLQRSDSNKYHTPNTQARRLVFLTTLTCPTIRLRLRLQKQKEARWQHCKRAATSRDAHQDDTRSTKSRSTLDQEPRRLYLYCHPRQHRFRTAVEAMAKSRCVPCRLGSRCATIAVRLVFHATTLQLAAALVDQDWLVPAATTRHLLAARVGF